MSLSRYFEEVYASPRARGRKREQNIAIALSKARAAGEDVPPRLSSNPGFPDQDASGWRDALLELAPKRSAATAARMGRLRGKAAVTEFIEAHGLAGLRRLEREEPAYWLRQAMLAAAPIVDDAKHDRFVSSFAAAAERSAFRRAPPLATELRLVKEAQAAMVRAARRGELTQALVDVWSVSGADLIDALGQQNQDKKRERP